MLYEIRFTVNQIGDFHAKAVVLIVHKETILDG